MTEKIKITSEQDYAIEYVVEQFGKDYTLNKTAGNYDSKWMDDKHLCLNSIKLADLARILYEPNSYEVKPSYEAGDWVITGRGMMGRFSRMEGQTYVFTMSAGNIGKSDNLRHATPEEVKAEKERRLWKSFGREINEWIHGDCIVIDGDYVRVNGHMGCDDENFNNVSPKRATERMNYGDVDGIFPAESFISFEEGEGE